MIADLSGTIAVLVSISLATERLVTIIKTMFPYLAVEKKTPAGETALAPDRPRRLALQALALAAAWLTASFLAVGDSPGQFTWNLFGEVQAGTLRLWVPLVAILASGGSAFWTQLLQHYGAVRDTAVTRKATESLEFRARALEMGARPADSGRDPREGTPTVPAAADAVPPAKTGIAEEDLLGRLRAEAPRHLDGVLSGRGR